MGKSSFLPVVSQFMNNTRAVLSNVPPCFSSDTNKGRSSCGWRGCEVWKEKADLRSFPPRRRPNHVIPAREFSRLGSGRPYGMADDKNVRPSDRETTPHRPTPPWCFAPLPSFWTFEVVDAPSRRLGNRNHPETWRSKCSFIFPGRP